MGIEAHTAAMPGAHPPQEHLGVDPDEAKIHRVAEYVLAVPRDVTTLLAQHFVELVRAKARHQLGPHRTEGLGRRAERRHGAWRDGVLLPGGAVAQEALHEGRLVGVGGLLQYERLGGVEVVQRAGLGEATRGRTRRGLLLRAVVVGMNLEGRGAGREEARGEGGWRIAEGPRCEEGEGERDEGPARCHALSTRSLMTSLLEPTR